MHKIPTLFRRDPDDMRRVLTEVHPDCEWVTAGEGVATRKWDGTCTMLDQDGQWWARREVKPGKTPPPNYRPVETDEETGKTVGWEPIGQSAFAKYHAEAIGQSMLPGPGTYELVGPKINGNPDGFGGHIVIPHGWAPLSDRLEAEFAPRGYDDLREWLTDRDWEGLVWHHPDGRMAKLKRRDFPRT
jgi:hypothetical protein